jgi:hypothetical protein
MTLDRQVVLHAAACGCRPAAITHGRLRRPVAISHSNSACVKHADYAYSMSTMVQIRNVPDELLHVLKARAAAQRMSLSDFLLARLGEIAAEPALDDVLDRLAALPRRDLGANATDLVAEARSE